MNNHQIFRKILLNVLNNQGYIVYRDSYPNYFEDKIQKAVNYKKIKNMIKQLKYI